MSKFARVAQLLSAVPPLLLGGAMILLITGVPPLQSAFWPEPNTNAAEAAAFGDVARLRLLADRGDDLRARLPVRAGLLPSGPGWMTPLEAAIRARNVTAFRVLWELSVPSSPDEIGQLRCFAREAGATDILERLSRVSTASGACD